MRCTAILLITTVLLNAVARAEPSPVKVEQSIELAKKYIYSLQQPDGTWERTPRPAGALPPDNLSTAGQWGGGTAVAVYALLVGGEKPNDPKLAKAIEFLQKSDITGTYAVAFKCQVWLNLPQTPEVKSAMRRDVQQIRNMARLVKGLTVWDYGPSTRKNIYSLSRSQYAALGLWAASEAGIEQPPEIWRAIEQTWEQTQTPEGGWKYRAPADVKGDATFGPTTVSMTAAALATLYIAQDFTKSSVYAQGRGNPRSEPIERGFKWMIENFNANVTPAGKVPPREYPFPQLYALERVGLASGLRRFGEFDWYARGAEWLMAKQKKDGSFAGAEGSMTGLGNACFAMLFLQRGRTPVAFNKLDYSPAVDDAKSATWNQRPRDIANVTRWLSKGLERELRWQVVDTNADLTALLEAPILYVAGGEALKLNDAAKKALKAYAQNGGLIVAHADTADAGFAKSIVDLGKELFGGEWRDLPATHPILGNQNYKIDAMKTKPVLRGISNGVREMIVLMPTGDHARAWQLRNTNARQESWQVMANLLSYATDKTTFYARGGNWLVPQTTPPSKTPPKKTITVGRLKYTGNFDPEPLAFEQLGRYCLAKSATAVKTQIVDAGAPVDASIKLLHVTGTSAFTFTEADRAALKSYVAAGGTLLFEAAGGNGEFAASAQGELAKLFGSADLKTFPPTHAIYGKDFKPEYRTYKITSIANPTAPQLAGVEQGGRVVALLSREDIATGLLGVPTDGIVGYKPASARELMLRVIASLK